MMGVMAEIESLARGELLGVLYRLGRGSATGVLSVSAPGSRVDVLVLRRGYLVTSERDADAAGEAGEYSPGPIVAAGGSSGQQRQRDGEEHQAGSLRHCDHRHRAGASRRHPADEVGGAIQDG